MAIMPGAIYRALPSKGRGKRAKGRGIVLHVAVSEAASLFGFFSTSTSDSHFYVRRDGTVEQYVDTDLVAYANMAGNATLISVETQGGVTNADGEPWTPQQVAALGRICAWAAAIDGFPLQAMPDSKPASRGVGYHRLGVKPWAVAGGELWSSSIGKVCPGAAKIAQIPSVIAAAKGGSPTISEEDDMTPEQAQSLAVVEANARSTNAAVGALNVAINDPAAGLYVQMGRLAAQVAALKSAPAPTSAASNGVSRDDVVEIVRETLAALGEASKAGA